MRRGGAAPISCGLLSARTLLPLWALVVAGCNPFPGGSSENEDLNGNTGDHGNTNDNRSAGTLSVQWEPAFDGSFTGGLTGVWGSDADHIFVVGGQVDQAEIYHFDGQTWQMMPAPPVALLSSVFGFGADHVFAVGEGGGFIHFDGTDWEALESGTRETLWSVWGGSPDDLWLAGGSIDDDNAPPILIHCDGAQCLPEPLPADDRYATALFDVFGMGSKLFAVGSLGLLIERDPQSGEWSQVSPGALANQDFVAIDGTSEDNLVAVGGSDLSGSRLARFDGTAWTTTELPGLGRLNALHFLNETEVIVAGTNGILALYDLTTDQFVAEIAETSDTLRGIWCDESEEALTVGGFFAGVSTGMALVRVPDFVQGVPYINAKQPDANGDGRPDAPLLLDGSAPDGELPVNENDNVSPPVTSQTIDLGLLDQGVFHSIEFGSEVPYFLQVQGGELFINPVIRVASFPLEAGETVVNVTHELVLRSSGSVISSSDGGLAILSHVPGLSGVFQVLRQYPFQAGIEPEAVEGELADFLVTLEYSGTTSAPIDPPIVETLSRSFILISAENEGDN